MFSVLQFVDDKIEKILSSTGWLTISWINEHVVDMFVDPEHVVELASESPEGDGSMVKDLKKNLR